MARVEEMVEVPVVAAFADTHVFVRRLVGTFRDGSAFAGDVRTGALGTPLIGIVEQRLAEVRVVIRDTGTAVAHDIRLERADHLRVAGVAAFRDVDVTAGEFERGVEFLEAALDVFLTVYDK